MGMWRASTVGLAIVAGVAACAPAEEEPVDPGRPVDPLYLPDVSAIDMPAAYAEAFALALDVRASAAWTGHVATLGMRTPGCPDLWVGVPEDTLDVDEDAPGLAWADHCDNGAGVDFGGAAYWETAVDVQGDAASAEGRVSTASRTLVADATVGAGADARFELDGEAQDSVSITEAPGYARYTWSSLVTGTVTGSEVFGGTATPGGYRTDVYLYAEGGETTEGASERLEARGNVYLFEDELAGRFDSVAMDLSYIGPTGAAPNDCTLEPTGWLSLRDADAYWYDLVFLPADAESVDTGVDPACDGCGALYIRGVAAGEVCVDLSAAWDGRLAPPSIADFALSIHDL